MAVGRGRWPEEIVLEHVGRAVVMVALQLHVGQLWGAHRVRDGACPWLAWYHTILWVPLVRWTDKFVAIHPLWPIRDSVGVPPASLVGCTPDPLAGYRHGC